MNCKQCLERLEGISEDLIRYVSENPGKIFKYYIIALTLLLLLGVRGSPWVNDETTYILMVDTIAKTGLPYIENGLSQLDNPQLILHATDVVYHNGVKTLAGIPSPLYPFIALPTYITLGIPGLTLLNLISFVSSIGLVFLISDKLVGSKKFALFSAVFFSLATYSIKYSVEIWPHSLSVALTLLPTYLILSDKGGTRTFSAGFFSALAVGIRYPNILFTTILLAYLIFKKKRADTILFILGAAIPLLAIGGINQMLWGSPIRTGYGDALEHSTTDFRLTNLIFGVLAFATVPKIGLRRSAMIFTTFFAVLLAIGWGDLIVEPAKIIISHIVDFSLNPRHYELLDKRAVLQVSPALALAVFGFHLMRNHKIEKPAIYLMIALPASEILFYGGAVSGDGGLSMMRYLLESIPYISIAAAYTITKTFDFSSLEKDIFTQEKINFFVQGTLILVLFILLESANLTASQQLKEILYRLPILLAIATLWLTASTKNMKALKYLIVTLISCSIAVNLVNVIETVSVRDYQLLQTKELTTVFENRSALLYTGYLDQVPIIPIKTIKNIDIAYLGAGTPDSNAILLGGYISRNITTYAIDGSQDIQQKKLIEKYKQEIMLEYMEGVKLIKVSSLV